MLPRWKTQFFIKFFEGGIIMQEGNRGQPKEDPFHVFVPLLPLNMAQNDISDSPIPSWNVPGPWNYPETAVSRQLLLTTALWNYAKSAPKFLNMGLTPPPFERCSKKLRIWWRGAPLIHFGSQHIGCPMPIAQLRYFYALSIRPITQRTKKFKFFPLIFDFNRHKM